MIHIEHLTARQKALAELLWTCETQEQIVDLLRALPTDRDKADASTLAKIMIWDSWEEYRGLEEYAALAADAIDTAMR